MENINILNMEDGKLPRNVQEAANRLQTAGSYTDQMVEIDSLLTEAEISRCDRISVTHLFIVISVNLHPKSKLRQILLKKLEKLSGCYQDREINVAMMQSLMTMMKNNPSLQIISNCLCHLMTLKSYNNYECIEMDVVEIIFSVVHDILQSNFLHCDRIDVEQMKSLHELVKSLTKFLKNNQWDLNNLKIGKKFECQLQALCADSINVTKIGNCPVELLLSIGQLFACIHMSVLNEKFTEVFAKYVSMEGVIDSYPTLTASAISILHGMMCSLDLETFCELHPTDSILLVSLLEMTANPIYLSGSGTVASVAMQVVIQWLAKMFPVASADKLPEAVKQFFVVDSLQFERLIEFIWFAWEHFLDSVQHAARDCFVHTLKLVQIINPNNVSILSVSIIEQLTFNKGETKKRIYQALRSVVSVMGTSLILDRVPNIAIFLVRQLNDTPASSHAAHLLEALFTCHFQEVSWYVWTRIWIPAFLTEFRQPMLTFGYEELLGKLLSLDAGCTDFALSIIESMELGEDGVCFLLILCAKFKRNVTFHSSTISTTDTEINDQLGSEFDVHLQTWWKGILPYETIEKCLQHKEDSVRMATLSLLCTGQRSTELFESQELDLLLQFYCLSLGTSDKAMQQEYFSLTKKLLLRIRDGVLSGRKQYEDGRSRENTSYCNIRYVLIFEVHCGFCEQLFTLLLNNLFCGANFTRRENSLRMLELLDDLIVSSPASTILNLPNLYDQNYFDTLIDCLTDTYDGNKKIALKLLESFSCQKDFKVSSELTERLLADARDLASSCKPTNTAIASYIFIFLSRQQSAVELMQKSIQFVCHLPNIVTCWYLIGHAKREIQSAMENRLLSALTCPIYGFLSCLRMQISNIRQKEMVLGASEWRKVASELICLCCTVTDLMSVIVESEAPEGCIPEELEKLEFSSTLIKTESLRQDAMSCLSVASNTRNHMIDSQGSNAQLLVLAGWHSVKESALILGYLVQCMTLPPEPNAILSTADVQLIGDYFIKHLSQVMHKGALEQTYNGFLLACKRLWSFQKTKELFKLPGQWLSEVLQDIEEGNSNSFSITRRSAGAPFVVQAVLTTRPKGHSSYIDDTMKMLLRLATKGDTKGFNSRVHAFNILRVLYRDGNLGDAMIPYVACGVMAALAGYKSTFWGERNAATLLLSALVSRMFGVKKIKDKCKTRHSKSSLSASVFFNRYPELHNFLRNELACEGMQIYKSSNLLPSAYPILLILSRLAPCHSECVNGSHTMSSFVPLLSKYLSHPAWQLRQLAADAIVPLVSADNLVATVATICQSTSMVNQNALHGALLCLIGLIEGNAELLMSKVEMNASIKSLCEPLAWAMTEINLCWVTRACTFQLFHSCRLVFGLSKYVAKLTETFAIQFMSVSSIEKYEKQSTPGWNLCFSEASNYLLAHTMPNVFVTFTPANPTFLISCNIFYDIIQLPPVPMIKKLSTILKEHHHSSDLRILIYNLIEKIVFPVDQFPAEEIGYEFITNQFNEALSQLAASESQEVKYTLLKMATSLSQKLKLTDMRTQELLMKWFYLLIKFSSDDQSCEMRFQSAVATSVGLQICTQHRMSDDAKLFLLEATLKQLQDEDVQVRGIAATSAWAFINDRSCLGQTCCELVLRKLLLFIAAMKTANSLSLLFKCSLMENEFNEKEALVFDRSELNSFQEEVHLARIIATVINEVYQGNDDVILFDAKTIEGIWILNQQQILEVKFDLVSLDYVLERLLRDITHVAIEAKLAQKVVLTTTNRGWLIRLARRTAVWKSFNRLSARTDLAANCALKLVQDSCIQTIFIREICRDLQD